MLSDLTEGRERLLKVIVFALLMICLNSFFSDSSTFLFCFESKGMMETGK